MIGAGNSSVWLHRSVDRYGLHTRLSLFRPFLDMYRLSTSMLQEVEFGVLVYMLV